MYRLRISITNFELSIWRRVHLADCNLFRLAKVIQAAMGWTGGREWLFDDGPDGTDENFGVGYSSCRRKFSRFVREETNPFCFYYGLGDYHWEHDVLFEGVVRCNESMPYPRCTAGEYACPPDEEEIGPRAYDSICQTLANPSHEQYEGTLEWLGKILILDASAFETQTRGWHCWICESSSGSVEPSGAP